MGVDARARPTGLHVAGEHDEGLHAISPLTSVASPFLTGVLPENAFQRWETQRGCAFRCSFCQHRGVSQRVDASSTDRLSSELAWLRESKTEKVNVLDPTFNHSTLHAVSVLERLHPCRLSLQTRPEKITARFLDAVERSAADVTLECGVQTFNAAELDLIGRVRGASAEATVRKVDEKLALLRERGVPFEISLIYGLPGQSMDSFKRSLERAHRSGAQRVDAFPLMLLRGTELHRKRRELGLVESCVVRSAATERIQSFIPHVVATPTMSTRDWVEMGALSAQNKD